MPTQPLKESLSPYFSNHLYEHNYFQRELTEQFPPRDESETLLAAITALAGEKNVGLRNEAQLEHDFIRPVLEALGWSCLPQVVKTFQGKEIKPDWSLFPSEPTKEAFLAETDLPFPPGTVLCEAKPAHKVLDTKKASKKDNPYIQLLEYLTYSRLPYGILTNGRQWWLIDNTRPSSAKRYIRVNLAEILEDQTLWAFRYFHFLFRKDTYALRDDARETDIESANRREAEARVRVENDLRSVVYGTDGRNSLFERLGQALYKASKISPTPMNLKEVFEDTLYLVFRLLFIANFEDKYSEQLDAHPWYQHISLRRLHGALSGSLPDFSGWKSLKTLFGSLADGNPAMGIPLLNGGLFDDGKAPLLGLPDAIGNTTLKAVLDDLLLYQGGLLRRDYRNLSVTHLGSIYEGLLDYEFRVTGEALVYLEYREGKELLSGYFDVYDATAIKNDPACRVLDERAYRPGTLYLVNTRNTRKASGSYYTPASLSVPLVRRAIDHQLEKPVPILDLRVLDNACGSGHLLIDALDYLTRKALDAIDADAALAACLREEKNKIERTFQTFRDTLGGFELEIDELAVLKRILLKRVIYGVDMQPFAVELAQLALWIDTFVFGTPLSFIEHHIKVGNSLIGTTMARFKKFVAPRKQFSLLQEDLNKRFITLHEVFTKLSAIRDTTPEEVKRSAEVYRKEIRPALEALDRALDVVNHHDMLLCEGKNKEAHELRRLKQIGERLLDGTDDVLAVKIAVSKEIYRFFNWEVEFPEAFATPGASGFHVIVGNPPWDKTKFLDPDFFSQYRSNYRSMSNSRKAEVRSDLLDSPDIRARYDQGRAWVAAVNKYYKTHFPLNSGAGDGNLFRFFVERNLSLLQPGGTLSYVLPTGLLTEEGSDTLRKHILREHHIVRFDGFENREKLFNDVDTRYKFGLLQVEKARHSDQRILMRFFLTDGAALETDEGVFEYGLDDITATSPDHMAFMEVGGGRPDLDLLRRIYGLFKPLQAEWLDFRNELHATNDKGIFLQTDAPQGLLPLCKGASIWQYDSLFASPEYWLDPATFDAHLLDREINRLIRDVAPQLSLPPGSNQTEAVLRALELKEKDELARFIRPDRHYYRMSFRDIARDTDERTLIGAVVPKDIGAQNTLWVSIPKRYILEKRNHVDVIEVSPQRLFFAQALFNAVPVDWVLRFSAAIHVNKTYLMRLPLPQPSDAELDENPLYAELVRNSLKLSLHFNPAGFEDLGRKFGISETDVPKTKKQVDRLKIRNDCLVAGLYGISPEELNHMLAGFKVLNRKKPHYVAGLREAYARYR